MLMAIPVSKTPGWRVVAFSLANGTEDVVVLLLMLLLPPAAPLNCASSARHANAVSQFAALPASLNSSSRVADGSMLRATTPSGRVQTCLSSLVRATWPALGALPPKVSNNFADSEMASAPQSTITPGSRLSRLRIVECNQCKLDNKVRALELSMPPGSCALTGGKCHQGSRLHKNASRPDRFGSECCSVLNETTPPDPPSMRLVNFCNTSAKNNIQNTVPCQWNTRAADNPDHNVDRSKDPPEAWINSSTRLGADSLLGNATF
mmetsp:Transcript_24169/g.77870  ORF Transcript_24169/g.77870 Transcript_24169/m.77870 type:complete len:264 (-) Transcript_24169:1241-2032(-)